MEGKTISCAKCKWNDVCGFGGLCEDYEPIGSYHQSEESAYERDLRMRSELSMRIAKEQGYFE